MSERIGDGAVSCPKCGSRGSRDVSYKLRSDIIVSYRENGDDIKDALGDVRDYSCDNCDFWWIVADENYAP